VVGALAVLGTATQSAFAGGWFWHGSPRVEVVIRPPVVRERVVVTRPVRVEMAPSDLCFTAYRSGDQIVVIANGSNRTTGFSTSFDACDSRDRIPTLVLHNVGIKDDCAGQAISRFAVTTSIHARHGVKLIKVNVCGQVYEVPVTARRHS